MDKTDKVGHLRALNEQTFRLELLIPLLGRMGLRAASEYHGTREHGKDIVCFDIDRLGRRRHLAIVAKTSDLTGSVSSSAGLQEALRQAEQCFNENYHDLFGMSRLTMDEVWIVTTGRVIPGAADSVFGKLEKTNLAKLTRIVSGEHLVELLDEHFPTYWNSAAESSEQVRAQRDRILAFLRNVLRKLGIASNQEAELLNTLLHSAWLPSVWTLADDAGSIVRASSYALTLAASSSRYPKGIASFECGDLARELRSEERRVGKECS